MLKITLIAVAAIVVLLIVVVALQPAAFRITRAATVSAPPAVVFALVNDLHQWEAWSPWAKLDPTMKLSYEGAPVGTGASYAWSGNNEVGEGRTTITESRPHELVGIKLQFVRPFACTNDVQFTFKPEGDLTTVTWDMTGRNNFVAKAASLCMNMDRMVGSQFEQGLASIKSLAEAEAKK